MRCYCCKEIAAKAQGVDGLDTKYSGRKGPGFEFMRNKRGASEKTSKGFVNVSMETQVKSGRGGFDGINEGIEELGLVNVWR